MKTETTIKPINYQPLPSSGRFLSEDWAQILGCEPETLRKNLKEKSIRTIVFGAKTIIDAEWFWADLIRCQQPPAV